MTSPKHFFLVVDGDARRGRDLALDLQREGCYVARASRGEDALRYAAENEPDAIVSDWRLEDMSGLEFARRIKERSLITRFILASDHADWRLLRQTLENGGNDLLSRPFSIDQLLRSLGPRDAEPRSEVDARHPDFLSPAFPQGSTVQR